MSTLVRLGASLAVVLSLFGAVYQLGRSHERAALLQAQANQVAKQAKELVVHADQQTEKANERDQKVRQSQAVYVDNRVLVERLRAELAAARAAAQAKATCAESANASAKLFSAMAADIEQLAIEGARIAKDADAHAADALMLQQLAQTR